MSDIKFAVGMSKEWDPYGAGHEATLKAISQLDGDPKFLLIFSTIHYDDEDRDIKKVLDGAQSVLGEGIPIIGGVVVGFICPEGCFMHGILAIVCSGTKVDCVIANSRNIFRSPIDKGQKLGNKIKASSPRLHNKHKILFNFLSGPIEPKMMANPKIREIIKKIPNKLLFPLTNIFLAFSMRILQYGPGTEEEVVEGISNVLPDFNIIGCSTFDDMRCYRHYQFYNTNVLKKSIVSLAVSFDNQVISQRKIPLIPLNKKLKLKRGWENYCIHTINDKPAVSAYLKEMGWPESYKKTHVEHLSRVTFHYPMAFRRDNWTYAFPAGFLFGEVILTNRRIHNSEVELFTTSAKKTIVDFKDLTNEIRDKKVNFSFSVAGMDIITVLGDKIEKIKDILDEAIPNSPYVVLFGSGEHLKKNDEKPIVSNFSMVMSTIFESKKNEG